MSKHQIGKKCKFPPTRTRPWVSEGWPWPLLHFEILHIPIEFLAQKVVILVSSSKMKFQHFCPPWKNLFGYHWKIHDCPSGFPLEKILRTPKHTNIDSGKASGDRALRLKLMAPFVCSDDFSVSLNMPPFFCSTSTNLTRH